MKEAEIQEIADIFAATLADPENEENLSKQKNRVEGLCKAFPIYKK